MDLTISRKEFKSTGIFSVLQDTDGNVIAHTLEHAYQSDTGDWLPKIPNGSYTCVRGPHRLHGMDADFTTFEITGVEGHTNLLFHAGNFNRDSEGCILVGDQQVNDMVTNSKVTFAKFMQIQNGVDQFTLTVQ